MENKKIVEDLKVLLASVFSFRIKTQFYHWNVTGPNFSEYHRLFGEIYSAADSDIDDIAEHIRALGAWAPGGFQRFKELSQIEEETTIPNALEMISRTLSDVTKIHGIMMGLTKDAEEAGQRGLVNFLEGLIDKNEKLQWMLRSFKGQ